MSDNDMSESSPSASPHSAHLIWSPHIVQKQGNWEEPTVGSFATSVVTPAVSWTLEPRLSCQVQADSAFVTAWHALQTKRSSAVARSSFGYSRFELHMVSWWCLNMAVEVSYHSWQNWKLTSVFLGSVSVGAGESVADIVASNYDGEIFGDGKRYELK